MTGVIEKIPRLDGGRHRKIPRLAGWRHRKILRLADGVSLKKSCGWLTGVIEKSL
jgi:hypothetical protein